MHAVIVETTSGKLRGIEEQTYYKFLGIPYAKPPVGELRFKPPQALERWEGIKECTGCGPAAPQLRYKELKVLDEDAVIDEDCLYLNVYTPAIDEKKRPILVYIHGGAFQRGSGNLHFNPQTYLEQDVVIVNLNFRIGAFGFLDMSAWLGDEYRQSGNSGLLDVVMALKWLRVNAGVFGGDPDNITIMGQSSVAKMVASLLVMETAKGNFDKAIICSGGVQCIRDHATATRVAEPFMDALGLSAENAQELLTLPWQKIVEAQSALFSGLNLHTVGPVFDGINFSGSNALDIIRSGKAGNIPVLIGTNRDEMQLFCNAYRFYDLDESMARQLFADNAPIVLREFAKRVPRDEHLAANTVDFLTEYIYRDGVVKLCDAFTEAGNRNVYLFRNDFDQQPMRAAHATEEQFTMRNYGAAAEKSDAYYALADGVVESISIFLRTGAPASAALPAWPSYADGGKMLVWDLRSHVEASAPSYVAPDMPEQVYIRK